MYRALEVAKMEAKRNRAGACEFGDGQPIFFLIFTFLLLTILSRRLQLLTTKQSTHKRALYTIWMLNNTCKQQNDDLWSELDQYIMYQGQVFECTSVISVHRKSIKILKLHAVINSLHHLRVTTDKTTADLDSGPVGASTMLQWALYKLCSNLKNVGFNAFSVSLAGIWGLIYKLCYHTLLCPNGLDLTQVKFGNLSESGPELGNSQ